MSILSIDGICKERGIGSKHAKEKKTKHIQTNEDEEHIGKNTRNNADFWDICEPHSSDPAIIAKEEESPIITREIYA